jgi:RND family efflux transporter MFP subunit
MGPVLIVFAGFAMIGGLFATRPQAEQKEAAKNIPSVEISVLEKLSPKATFSASGRVIPAQMVVVNPQVSGRITNISKNLQPGGRLNHGEFLAQIDKRDYELALAQSKANAESARVQLALEKAQQNVARKDWSEKELSRLGEGDARALALKEPQVQRAEMAYSGALSSVKRAELSLSRTKLLAPFNCVIQSEAVDVGQVVGPQSRIATLIGTNAFWVQVSVPVSTLSNLAIPGLNAEKGGDVRVTHAGENNLKIVKTGNIIRYLGELDGTGHMAQLLIEIPDPLGLKSKAPIPLLTGARVTVDFIGKAVENVYKIPRNAMRQNNTVFLLNKDNRLEKQVVETAWRDVANIWTRSLKNGDRLITSPIALPVEGMQLKSAAQGAQ